MPVIKCPSCGKSLNLKQAPSGGKVKCPGCAHVITLGGGSKQPSGSARAAKPAAGGRRVLTPNDEGFDFSQIQFPSAGPAAVSQYPTAGSSMQVYSGPIPGDPLADELAAQEGGEVATQAGPAAQSKNTKGKLSPAMLAGILGGVALLMVVAIVIGVVVGGGGGGSSNGGGGGDASAARADAVAEAKRSVPEGFQLIEVDGSVVYMPKGELVDVQGWKSSLDSKAVRSNETDTFFLFGVMGVASDADNEKIRKIIGRQFTADYLGGNATTRNGYEGIKGMISESLFVPRMQCETYKVDGRLFVLGVARGSEGAEPGTVNLAAESREVLTFMNSITVGPKTSGGLFW